MKGKGRTCTTMAMVGALVCSTLSVGCEPSNFFRSNFNLDIIVPFGLAGTPGIFNPFGVVQAIVNALLSSPASSGDAGTGDEADGDTTPLITPATPGSLDPGISVVVTGPTPGVTGPP